MNSVYPISRENQKLNSKKPWGGKTQTFMDLLDKDTQVTVIAKSFGGDWCWGWWGTGRVVALKIS